MVDRDREEALQCGMVWGVGAWPASAGPTAPMVLQSLVHTTLRPQVSTFPGGVPGDTPALCVDEGCEYAQVCTGHITWSLGHGLCDCLFPSAHIHSMAHRHPLLFMVGDIARWADCYVSAVCWCCGQV